MTQTQEYLLKLLKEIDEICVANGIEYYIFAGSMLGLERNEGFLPWDDDVDVVMTKKNYDRFSELMKTRAPENRTFECVERNKEYPLQFGKYISTNTSHITRSLAFGNSSAGIWIDIMYVAPLPNTPGKAEKVKKWFCCYCELENEIYIEHKNRYEGFYWRYKLGRRLIAIFGKERVIRWMKKRFDHFPEEKCEEYFLYHALAADFRSFNKKFFEKPVRRQFGGVEVYASPHNREFCRAGYGDSWMMIPQEEEQETHTVILDFELPYYKYVEDYMVFLDKEEVDRDIKEAKQLELEMEHIRRTPVQEKYYLKGVLLSENLKNRIKEEKIDPAALAEREDYAAIGALYQDYLELQFDRSYRMWQIFVAIDDELLYPILKKLICFDGKYYDAAKILKLRQTKRTESEPASFTRLRDLIRICRNLSVALWDKEDYKELNRILKEDVRAEEIFCINIELARLYALLHHAENRQHYTEIKQKAKRLLEKVPKQGECLKILADAELGLGNHQNAERLYDEAYSLTSNGLVRLDITRKKGACRREG